MRQTETILAEMENLLDHLIGNARELLAISKQVIEEQELIRLQQIQDELLTTLVEKDAEFHLLPEDTQKKFILLRYRIDEKIDEFQQLNADFLENISNAQGVIQFNKGRLKKRDGN